jgi:CDP-diacylglycerol--glycerol-3-phosphate 3-phosphatidyltransferase
VAAPGAGGSAALAAGTAALPAAGSQAARGVGDPQATGAAAAAPDAAAPDAAAPDAAAPDAAAPDAAAPDAVTPDAAAPDAGMPTAVRLANVANALTVLRLAFVPVFVVFLLRGGTLDRIIAFLLFVAASFTDFLDGRLARKHGLITDFGKIADPIADKALTGSALITLSYLGELPWWVTGLILFREVGVTVLRFWVIRRGVIPASRGGKLKTLLQVIAIGLYVLPGPPGLVREILMAAALVVTLATGGDYVLRAISLRRGRAGARGARKEIHG